MVSLGRVVVAEGIKQKQKLAALTPPTIPNSTSTSTHAPTTTTTTVGPALALQSIRN
jgi:hypothetical protein